MTLLKRENYWAVFQRYLNDILKGKMSLKIYTCDFYCIYPLLLSWPHHLSCPLWFSLTVVLLYISSRMRTRSRFLDVFLVSLDTDERVWKLSSYFFNTRTLPHNNSVSLRPYLSLFRKLTSYFFFSWPKLNSRPLYPSRWPEVPSMHGVKCAIFSSEFLSNFSRQFGKSLPVM